MKKIVAFPIQLRIFIVHCRVTDKLVNNLLDKVQDITKTFKRAGVSYDIVRPDLLEKESGESMWGIKATMRAIEKHLKENNNTVLFLSRSVDKWFRDLMPKLYWSNLTLNRIFVVRDEKIRIDLLAQISTLWYQKNPDS